MPVKKIVPNERPKISESAALQHLLRHGIEIGQGVATSAGVMREPLALLGLRGYYARTLGETPANERNIYDDCLIVISPNVFAAFNANTDPSITRKGMACLVPGEYRYTLGTHNGTKAQYKAVIQLGQVTVVRDGLGVDRDAPPARRFGINIHKGGFTNTSSEGCQTIYPDQWASFLALVTQEARRYGAKDFPYVLIEV